MQTRLSSTAGVLLLLSALLGGCAGKRVEPSVGGSDEERLDAHAARLEEYRSLGAAGELDCPQTCPASREVCSISTEVCQMASRLEDRPDVTARCTQSQEDCAQLTDACSRCPSGG